MDTPGTILRREREARGIPLKEIASITRIPVSALRHLEEDRYDQFPAEVFAKGFLRNYARELQIGADDVMLAYQALKQHQLRQDVGMGSEARKRDVAVAAPTSRRPRRSVRRELSERRDVDTVTPLVLAAPDGERESAPSAVDTSQRTFRFAYLIVFLVVVTSLGLSVLFTGTGEAEENSRRRARPVLDDTADKGSRWLMSDQRLTTKSLPAAKSGESLATDPVVVPTPAVIDTAAVPADAPPSTERWNRPAFPQDDHE